jgi:hypothetical protein
MYKQYRLQVLKEMDGAAFFSPAYTDYNYSYFAYCHLNTRWHHGPSMEGE